MSRNYHIDQPELKVTRHTARDRLAYISRLLSKSTSAKPAEKISGRNVLTRSLDTAFAFVRDYLPPIHWFFAAVTAIVFFLYARLVAVTARLDDKAWPVVCAPCVLALWHRDAPSLLVTFAKRRLTARTAIMISRDPRGDYIAMLCRWLGFAVVRGDTEEGGWEALQQLANELVGGAIVILTADGGGPARIAKVGAVVLASSAGVPLVPLITDCHPAILQPHKWDAARNPVPFCKITVSLGPPRVFDFFKDLADVEEARAWLEQKLNHHREQ